MAEGSASSELNAVCGDEIEKSEESASATKEISFRSLVIQWRIARVSGTTPVLCAGRHRCSV